MKNVKDKIDNSIGSMDKVDSRGEVSDRYVISIPFYGDQKLVEHAMQKIAKEIDVPYISLHSQFKKDGYETKFVKDVEY